MLQKPISTGSSRPMSFNPDFSIFENDNISSVAAVGGEPTRRAQPESFSARKTHAAYTDEEKKGVFKYFRIVQRNRFAVTKEKSESDSTTNNHSLVVARVNEDGKVVRDKVSVRNGLK